MSNRTLLERYYEYIHTERHREADMWPLMGGPLPVMSITLLYLAFVLKVGPKLMEKRKPFNLQTVLVLYNFCLVLFSLYIFILPFSNGLISYFLTEGLCNPKIPSDELLYNITTFSWWYVVSKAIELVDTVFFVLRKKNQHITFLHVYHHGIMLIVSWTLLKYLPCQPPLMHAIVNSLVHVVMYAYYMLAAMGPRFQKYLWWKRYLTLMQLTQFSILLVYEFYLLLFGCNHIKSLLIIIIGMNIFFWLMFMSFYRATYMKKAKD
ncbi:very long chain fatty acid elongase AAEL008004-like isoform X2 [Periplaneta americana]|uniref:very long chain fatty acid elongase AAEL008004-like isoform X2 n=1 Tax=Periplaneta americana TaxID=6978 RepID=UPI0037E801D5